MSRLPTFKRLITEDFEEEDRKLVTKIAYVLNTAFEDVFNALNKNLSIEDNLNLVKRDITVTVDASGVPISPLTVKSNLATTCRGMIVIKAVNNTDPSVTPTGTPWITFSDNSGLISISKISNLQADNSYTLRLIFFP